MVSQTKLLEYPALTPFNKNNGVTPDIYYEDTTKVIYPSDDFVISRDLTGEILSRYGDLSYELKPYSTTKNGKTKIPFDTIEGRNYQYEARWLWFICYRFGKGKNKNNYTVGILYSRFIGFIKPLCQFSKIHNTSAIKVLETKALLAKFIHENDTAMFNKQVLPTLNLYHSLKDIIGFSVALNDEVINLLNKRSQKVASNKNQTEIIPPRLYGLWLNEAWSIIDEFEKHSINIKNLIFQLIKENPYHRNNYTRDMRSNAWQSWIRDFKLTQLANSRNFSTNRRTFHLYLSDVMLICKGLIHFYSGMRDDEVLSLNYHCLQLDKVNNRKKARLLGNTTKYIGSNKPAQWVTTVDIERTIIVLQTIVEPLSTLINVTVNPKILKGETPCPLFLSPNYIQSKEYRKRHPSGKTKIWNGNSSSFSNNSLFNKDLMKITEEDIQYLEKFEPERNWRQSEYAVGKIWHLKTHQFRRSLAVYSAQSGLVSIGSLQAQLKHLCQEVTFYYGNNAERAANIFDIESKNHMAHQFIKEKPIADYTAWVWQILFSDEKLGGINGRIIERTIKGNTPEARVIIRQDRKKTIKQFKDGQRAYTDTPLGGCETITPCDKKLMHSLTACIDCNRADLKPSKVSRTIDSMTIFVNSLPPDSVEFRTERSELDKLMALKARMEKD